MKKGFLHLIKKVGLLFIGLLLVSGVNAENIILKRGGKTELEIARQNENSISFINKLEGLKVAAINTSKRNFVRLGAPGYIKSGIVGSPELPQKTEIIEIPLGANPQVKIRNFSMKEISLGEYSQGVQLIPAQASLSKSEDFQGIKYDEKAYLRNEYNASKMVEIKILGIMRGVRLALVTVNPIQYNPVSNNIKVFEDIEFDIVMEGADIKATKALQAKTASPFFNSLNSRMFKNHRDHSNFTKYPVKYVIVADRMFEEELQDFIAWKTKKGFKVITAYTDESGVGNTKSSIKGYLKGLYNAATPEDPAPSFALFVGDVNLIPAYEPSGNGETDRFYCEYTNDLFPEIYYGRFSVQTTEQCAAMVEKTLMYEQYTMPDPTYLDNVLLVSGVDANMAPKYGNGTIRYGVANYFNEEHNLDTEYYLYPESAGVHDEIITAISNGVTFSNYTAHCSPDGWADPVFSRSNVNELTNEDKYGLLVGNCCSSSEFAQNECFSEKITRTPKKGAWGYIGGSNSTYWDEDYYWGIGLGTISSIPPSYEESTLGVYDRMFHDHGEAFDQWYVTGSQAIFAGNLCVTAANSTFTTYYWDIYNLAGDPSTMVYMGIPSPIEATYPAAINIGATEIPIEASPYAYIGISKDGILLGAGLADETGHADISLTGIDFAGNIDVVITAQNKQPFSDEILVKAADGPYVMIESSSVNDTEANNNSQADFNEDIRFDITLKNYGNAVAENLVVNLVSNDPMVTVIESSVNWADIAAEASLTQTGQFKLHLDEMISDNQIINLDLSVSNGDKTWASTLKFTSHAAILSANPTFIIEEVEGNMNGQVDAGEIIILKAPVQNSGSSLLENLVGTISSSNSMLEILEASSTIASLAADATEVASFKIKINDACLIGEAIAINANFKKGNIEIDQAYQLNVGLVTEDFESGDFSKHPWELKGYKDWVIKEGGPEGSSNFAHIHMPEHNKEASLELDYNVGIASPISFDMSVSSESGYDFLEFFVDGTSIEKWSGEVEWKNVSFDIAEGEHHFKWEFQKDFSTGGGDNSASLDNIIFPLPKQVIQGQHIKIEDLALNFSDANSNELVEAGELIHLNASFSNIGDEKAENLSATISNEEGLLLISETNITLEDIEPNYTLSKEAIFGFKLQPNFINNTTTKLVLTVTNGSIEWTSNIDITGITAEIIAGKYIKIDDASGNNNRQIDAGEEINLSLEIEHIAGMNLENLNATFASLNEGIQMIEAITIMESFDVASAQKINFKFQVNNSLTPGTEVLFNLDLSNDQIQQQIPYSFIIGKRMEDFESQNFEAFPWEITGYANWEIVEGGQGSSAYAAKVALIEGMGIGQLTLKVIYPEAGKLSFDLKTVDLKGAHLGIKVDDEILKTWDGEIDWETVEFDITAGFHTLEWFIADGNQNNSGYALLDNIVFPTDIQTGLEDNIAISQNASVYPNPTKDWVNVTYATEGTSEISIQIYNTMGQLISIQNEGIKTKGTHQMQFNADGFASGAYQLIISNKSSISSCTFIVK